MNEAYQLDKRYLRRSFDRAAKTYDSAAGLQREISTRMRERLQYIKHEPDWILDAGAGTGISGRPLLEAYPKAKVIALDIAFSMLKQGRATGGNWKRFFPGLSGPKDYPLCADVDFIPLKTSSMDMVWSNLSLQWSNNLSDTFAEIRRVLAPGGLLMFSTFGPDTLKELRQAFGKLDGYTHTSQFADMHDIGDILINAGFATPVMDMEHITVTYADLKSLMRELKALGAHNATQGRRHGMMGKKEWNALEEIYEAFRCDNRLPATFEVIYGHGWINDKKPALTDGRQIIEFQIQQRKSGNR